MSGTPPILFYGKIGDNKMERLERLETFAFDNNSEPQYYAPKSYSLSFTIENKESVKKLLKTLYYTTHTFDINQPRLPRKTKKRIKREIASNYRIKQNKVKFKYPNK